MIDLAFALGIAFKSKALLVQTEQTVADSSIEITPEAGLSAYSGGMRVLTTTTTVPQPI